MVTVKFEAEKANNEFVVLPTIVVTTGNEKNCTGLSFGWLKSILIINISWSRKAIRLKAQLTKSSC